MSEAIEDAIKIHAERVREKLAASIDPQLSPSLNQSLGDTVQSLSDLSAALDAAKSQ